MGKHYELNIDDIDIDDWNAFVERNDEIVKDLDICCSNVADMIANVSSTLAMVPQINAAFAKLKTVEMTPLPSMDYLDNQITTINDYMKNKALVICGGLYYGEIAIDAYRRGKQVDPEARNLFDAILKGLTDASVFWILQEALKSGPFAAKALGFVLAYGTDAKYEGSHFVVGDGAKKLFDIATDVLYLEDIPVWVNTAVGTAAVVLVTGVMEYINHEGEWSNEDIALLLAKAGEAGLSYLEWVAITGAIAGPGGVVVAALLAIPTSMLWNVINDIITGDYSIDTFERDGKTYVVTENGKGSEGTFDMIIDKYSSLLQEYHMGDRLCSEHEYKETMYLDLEEFAKQNCGEQFGEVGGDFFAGETFTKGIEAMAKCETFEEAMDAFYEAIYAEIDGVDADVLAGILITEYDFDFMECYEYVRKHYLEGDY